MKILTNFKAIKFGLIRFVREISENFETVSYVRKRDTTYDVLSIFKHFRDYFSSNYSKIS